MRALAAAVLLVLYLATGLDYPVLCGAQGHTNWPLGLGLQGVGGWGVGSGRSPKQCNGFMFPEPSLLQQKYLHFLRLGHEGFCPCATLSRVTALSQAGGSEWTVTRDLGTLHLVMQPSYNIVSSELMVGSVGIQYGGKSSGLQSRKLGCLFQGAAQT